MPKKSIFTEEERRLFAAFAALGYVASRRSRRNGKHVELRDTIAREPDEVLLSLYLNYWENGLKRLGDVGLTNEALKLVKLIRFKIKKSQAKVG